MATRATGKGLGRGLSALLGEPEAAAPRGAETIPIDRIRPNPDQPRRRFDETELEGLAVSIRERGVLQPLILRPDPSGDGYQIVAGERRWRAAQRAQLHEVPAVVRELDDATVLEIALVENVQRADLTPIEEARGYARLMKDYAYTQERVSEISGKSRSHVANTLRLLALPDEVMAMIADGRLTAGHGRALVGLPEAIGFAQNIIARGMSVREAEAMVKRHGGRLKERPRPPEKDADTRALEADLSAALKLTVTIEHKGETGGEVRLRYRNLDELDAICERLGR